MVKCKKLIYDIETSLSISWLFSLGEQRVGHNQLLSGYFSRPHIMTISYMWEHENKVHTLTWGDSLKDEKDMIYEFDQIIKEADVVIGKNSDRFDNKHINSQRMFFGLDGMPDWTKYTDDLEKQMRKYFNLPSQSLDYISTQLGYGGKDKMSFGDWVAIARHRAIQLIEPRTFLKGMKVASTQDKQLEAMCQIMFGLSLEKVIKEGTAALTKMIKYNKKDVKDTRNVMLRLAPHIKLKFNVGAHINAQTGESTLRCRHCGSDKLVSNGSRITGGRQVQKYDCKSCYRYAGFLPMPVIKGVLK